MGSFIGASRLLTVTVLLLLAWSDVAARRAEAVREREAAASTAQRSAHSTSRGGPRPTSNPAEARDLLVVRSLLPASSPTPLPTSAPVPTPVPEPAHPKDLGLFKVTAYSDSPHNGTDGRGITKSGERTRWGVVAVDPSVIPLGSRLRIEGMEETLFSALDTGGGVTGAWLDVWFRTDREALQHGVKERRVYLVPN